MKYIYITFFFTLVKLGFSQSISGVINSYYEATAINIPANSITLANTTGLNIGDRVLIIQMKGATYNTSNSASYGDITAINGAGLYEFNNICSISGNDIVLQYTLLNSYGAGGANHLQVIKVPQYTNPVVTNNLTCQPWNGATGGVLVLEATGTLTLNDTITVKDMGFKGGKYKNWTTPSYTCNFSNFNDYFITFAASGGISHGGMKGEGIADTIVGAFARGKQVNGGGGGNNHNAGGGGGGNYGAGGIGGVRTHTGFTCHGPNPGAAGIALSSYGYSATNNRIFLGGGGGAGHGNNLNCTPGGDGGGIIIIRANAIDGNGYPIIADGRKFYPMPGGSETDPGAMSDGGGGGGAGGVIILDVVSVISATSASARGGRGSNASWGDTNCFGPGGGGGGGVIWVSAASVYPLLSTDVTGGPNGVRGPSAPVSCDGSSGSAAPGADGAVLYNYTAPINTIEFCTTTLPIAQNVLKGIYQNEAVLLSWHNPENVYTEFIVERSQNGVFTPLTRVNYNQPLQAIDKHPYQGKNLYRLQMIDKDGKIKYSNIVEIYTQYTALSSNVYPNPAWDEFTVECYTQQEKPIEISIFDVLGNRIYYTQQNTIQIGKNTWSIPVQNWSKGMYYLHIIQGTEKVNHKVIKL